jgi:hypothetical protein
MIAPGSLSVATALRLLSRLCPGSSSDSLAGDLAEEHQQGRSALWVWMQVLTAILISAWEEIRAHKLTAVGGIVTGLASLWCLGALETFLLISAGFPHAVDWQWQHRLTIVAVGCTHALVSGWIVGRVHGTHRTAAVFAFLASVWLLAVLELPLLYWLAPAVFSVTVVPLLPMILFATVLGAPVAIIVGGFCGTPETPSRITADQRRR